MVLISDMWKIWEGRGYFLLKLYGCVVKEKESGSKKIRIPTKIHMFQGRVHLTCYGNLQESRTICGIITLVQENLVREKV